MASFTLKLTPNLINHSTEGGLDTSVSGGVSAQRTGYIETVDGDARKVSQMNDGVVFTDVVQVITSHAFISGV